MRVPARQSRVSTARRLASASIIRCCAAVGGSAALRMRHTPCGCRSAHLVGVQPNHRLSPVSRMWRAQQCHIPQAVCCRGTRKVFLPSIQNSLKALYFLDFRAFSPAQLSPCSLAFRGINSHIFSLKSSTKSSKLRGKSAFYYSPFATLFNSSFASSYPKWV